MPIDPRISLAVQPMQIESPVNNLAKMLALKESMQSGQLNQLKLQEAQRSAETQNKLSSLLASGADLNDVNTQNQVYGLGGGDILKQRQDILKSQEDAKKTQVENAKNILSGLKTSATAVMANPTLEFAKSQVMRFGKMFNQDITDDLAQLDALGENPQAIAKWAAGHALEADKLLPKFESRDLGGTVQRQGYDPLTGTPIGPAQTTKKTMAPGEARRLELESRRVDIAQQGADRKTASSKVVEGLTPKEVQKREASFPKAKLALEQAESNLDKLSKDLIALKDDPGLSQITGLVYGNMPAGASVSKEARRAKALLENILARGQFQELQNMRNSSPTGGALGNISNQEGQYLRQAFAALDRAQDTDDVKNVITNLVNDLQASKQRVRDAFDLTYEYKGATGSPSTREPSKPDGGGKLSVSNW